MIKINPEYRDPELSSYEKGERTKLIKSLFEKYAEKIHNQNGVLLLEKDKEAKFVVQIIVQQNEEIVLLCRDIGNNMFYSFSNEGRAEYAASFQDESQPIFKMDNYEVTDIVNKILECEISYDEKFKEMATRARLVAILFKTFEEKLQAANGKIELPNQEEYRFKILLSGEGQQQILSVIDNKEQPPIAYLFSTFGTGTKYSDQKDFDKKEILTSAQITELIEELTPYVTFSEI